MKQVSIIIPTYNQAEFIEVAVNSALSQTYTALEVIVSDDASSDDTQQRIVKLRHPKLKYYRNTSNLGRVGNYRKALYDYASGDLVLCLDGDDYLIDNDYISKAVRIFEQEKNLALVFADIVSVFQQDGVHIHDQANKKLPSIMEGNWLLLNYHLSYSIAHQSSLYVRQWAIELDYYRINMISADWESVLRLIQNHKVAYIPTVVAAWRKHIGNASRAMQVEPLLEESKYVEAAYLHAQDAGVIPQGQLSKWRNLMLKRVFINGYVKLLFMAPDKRVTFLSAIKVYDKIVYSAILKDGRFQLLRWLSPFRKLLRWGFTYILHQEAFIKDLEYYETNHHEFAKSKPKHSID